MPLLGLEFETLALSAEQMRLLTRFDLELWLVRQSNPAAQRLTGRIATDWNEQDIRELVRNAFLDFSGAAAPVGPPSNADPLGNQNTEVTGWERAVQIVQILGKIIAAKNAAEHSSPPSTGNVSTQRYYINPFRGDVVTAQARVRVWRRQLGAAIKKAGPEESPSRGLVLLSAALYGGIFDTDVMVAVARALGGTPGTLGLANQHLYLQISVAWRKMQDLTRRTWYPDPLTATLIARMPPGQPEGVEEGKDLRYNKLLWQEMIGALRSAGIDRTDEPKSLASFFSDLRVVSQLEMPSLLAAYAAHDIRSQGLPARTLRRIYSVRPAQPISADTSKQAKNRRRPEDKKVLDSLADNPPNAESEWRIQLRKVLVQENRGDALKVLHKLQRDEFLDGSARCLIFGFTSHLLSPENGGKQMQMTTVRLWVRTVIRHIGDVLQETEADLIVLSRVSSEILEDIYRDAIEEIDPEDETSSVRKRLAHVLRAFHDFLVRKHRVKPLEDSSLLSVHRLGTPVDANLITVEEYHKILDWLDRNWPPTLDPGLRPLARMMVILGFRCGLRRSEALGISCHAVCGLGPKPELLIQPSFGHRLKSDNSKRRLPLFLMPEQERRHFLRLVTQGKSEQYISTPALLTIAGSYGLEVSPRRLLPIIHQAMRAVTKDPSLRFHHLRHSFATWTLMRLMIGESGICPKHFEHLPETQSWLAQSREFCTQIYDVLPSTTRMHAYLVAQMMGHSHPSVTLRYYVHGMDWLLDSYLRAIPEFQPNSRTVVLASGLAERTAYNITKRGVAIGPAKRTVNDCATIKGTAAIPARLLKVNWPEMSTATSPDPEKSSLWPWRAWDLLYRRLCLGDELSQIAGDYGFSPDQAIGFLQRSTYLCQMHARVGRKGERRGWQHGMVLGSPGGVGRGARISCPIRVSIKTDIAVVTRFAPALTRLMDGAPEFRSVLRYYVDNIWQDWNQLFFRDPGRPDDANAYLKLLEEIGVKRSQLRFSVLHKLEHCEQLELWKEVLKLPKNISIVRLTPPNAKSHSYDSWIGIEPSLSKSKPAPGNNGTGTYGFRFLMLMGHIVHGATDTEQVCIDLIDELDQAPDSPLKDRIRPGKYRFSSRDRSTRLATRLYNPEAKGYLNHPHEAGTNPRRRLGKKTKCVGADELLPVIQRLLRPGGLLCEKTYAEQKRLLIDYLHAGSETFPKQWRNSRGSTCRILQISGISGLIRLMPLVMKFCDSRTNSAYTLETFKRELGQIAAVSFHETTS
jgi:integrase